VAMPPMPGSALSPSFWTWKTAWKKREGNLRQDGTDVEFEKIGV
jgi:hypothetical protein